MTSHFRSKVRKMPKYNRAKITFYTALGTVNEEIFLTEPEAMRMISNLNRIEDKIERIEDEMEKRASEYVSGDSDSEEERKEVEEVHVEAVESVEELRRDVEAILKRLDKIGK